MPNPPEPRTVDGQAHVFGHDPSPVRLSLVTRSTSWRAGHAARYLAAGAVIAPIVAVVPPHAPWAVGAGAGGVLLALRKWHERFTLVEIEGACPRCSTALDVTGHPPLKMPHTVGCDGCGSPVRVTVEPAALDWAPVGEAPRP